MQPTEALAVARLRQWCADRIALHHGRTTDYQRAGWQARDTRQADARIVRVVDFSRALASLTGEEQAALILHYRDREPEDRIALALRCSIRKVCYVIPQARQKLAARLDALDLL
jgi:DNA-directed RNA polymerase specialized sigma24 family protein